MTSRFMGGITLNEACQLFKKRPHPATVWRWCVKGIRGVKLMSWMVGGIRCTDEQAIQDFLEALNRGVEDKREIDARIAKQNQEVDQALRDMGC